MKFASVPALVAAAVFSLALSLSGAARANDDASNVSAVALFPLASVAAAGSNAVGASVTALPELLSGAGTLVVKGVNGSANGTMYVLERASDGAQVSVQVAGKVAGGASAAVGTAVTVTAFSAGVVLSVAGDIIAFIPNTVGAALLHHERLSN